MLHAQRIAQLIADLGREATTSPLSPERLALLQTLNKDLGDVLATADKALRGGFSLEGDLWPTTEDIEEETMDQAHLLLLIDELDAIGVSPAARQDALHRAAAYFGGHDVEPWEMRDFVQQLRKDAPHLFRQGAAAPTAAPATASTASGKKKEERRNRPAVCRRPGTTSGRSTG